MYTPNIHALSAIRIHDPSVLVTEDSSCLRPCGYCDRPLNIIRGIKSRKMKFSEREVHIGDVTNTSKIVIVKPEGKTPKRREDDI
jgi:hypothetical protein